MHQSQKSTTLPIVVDTLGQIGYTTLPFKKYIPIWDILKQVLKFVNIFLTKCEIMKKSIHTTKYKKFCELLTNARESKNLTQKQVAKKLGKPQSFVSKYENGERRLDVLEFLEICKAIDTNPKKIIDQI
jgi:DNA-binding transcriptional regulator YiaG